MHAASQPNRLGRAGLALTLGLTLFSGVPAAEAYTLVMMDGKRVELAEKPTWGFGRASVKAADGSRRTLLHAAVDHRATSRANPEVLTSAQAPKVWTLRDLRELPASSDVTVFSSSPLGPNATRGGGASQGSSEEPQQGVHQSGQAMPLSPGAGPGSQSVRSIGGLSGLTGTEYHQVSSIQRRREREQRLAGTEVSRSEAARRAQASFAKSRASRASGRTTAGQTGSRPQAATGTLRPLR